MKILKILVEIDSYKKPEQSVVLADTEDVREYIEANIIPQMNKPVYADHELFVTAYVIDGATEHDLIPLLLAKYYLEKYSFSDKARVAWSLEYHGGVWAEQEEAGDGACQECGKVLPRYELCWSHDCYGNPFRLLCGDCWKHLMANGYDGEYYDERGECLDDPENE